MDPDACLAELRNLVTQIEAATDKHGGEPITDWPIDTRNEFIDNADRMAELVDALDGWISKGGFLPARWQRQ